MFRLLGCNVRHRPRAERMVGDARREGPKRFRGLDASFEVCARVAVQSRIRGDGSYHWKRLGANCGRHTSIAELPLLIVNTRIGILGLAEYVTVDRLATA